MAKKKLDLKWFNFLMLTISGTINAIGVTIFLYPVHLYDSGISGTSMLLAQVTPEWLPLAFFLVVLNVPLFLFGLKRQGLAFTIYSVYAVAIYSLVSFLITNVLPIDVTTSSPIAGNDILLCALFGGLVSGVGSGLTIRYGGAIDGVEVMAVIFSKALNITVGTFVMIYNVLLYVVCGIVFSSWILPLYSIVTYMVGIKAVDFVVEGIDKAKAAIIITTKPEEVKKALQDKFKVSPTVLSAKGGYSGEDRTMLYFVVNRFQIYTLKNLVHEQDEKAYITINDVSDVFKANN